MTGGLYGVLIVCVLVLLFDKLIQADEICRSPSYDVICDSGYHCCDENTRCCSSGLSLAAVIGIVFSVLFVLTTCVVCAVIVSKKKKQNNVVTAGFSNQPHQQTVTITNISSGPGGYGPPVQPIHQYGYGFGQPHPVHAGMPYVAPPPYSQCGVHPFNQPGQPMMSTAQPGMSASDVEPSSAPMFRPLVPAYTTPARSMFKLNSNKTPSN